MFEVQDLRYATLATVSRCGMVWFSEEVLSVDMMCENFMQRLRNVPVEEGEEDMTARARGAKAAAETDEDLPASLHVCSIIITVTTYCIAEDGTLFVCMQSPILCFIVHHQYYKRCWIQLVTAYVLT